MKIFECFFDGSAKPNPGEMKIGGVIKTLDGTIVEEYSKDMGFGTNNQAEYMSFIYLLEIAAKHLPDKLIIKGDSALVVNQVNGAWKVKDIKMRGLCDIAKNMVACFPEVKLEHVKRHLNKEADSLTR